MRGGLRVLDASGQCFLLRAPAGTTWEHCAHLLAPVGVAEDTVSHSLLGWQVCWRWEAGDQGSSRQSQWSSHL